MTQPDRRTAVHAPNGADGADGAGVSTDGPDGPHTAADRAREYFPRGLEQPEAGFRFSMDALLLASFPDISGVRAVADLGCGCGVVGLGLQLRRADAPPAVTGIDLDPGMIACARANAARLGLADRYTAVDADVAAVRGADALRPESADLVVCNPPYRDPASGRRSPDPGRDAARFEASAPIAAFVAAAAYLLQNRKRACFIGLAERVDALLADCAASRLAPKRLRFVHSRPHDPARLVLAECVKNGGPGLTVEPPLVLYGSGGRLSADALRDCPFLECNP